MNDLQVGMVLEGVVSNVANFGAFVDIGVHQDGLVHISALADRFVQDPRDVVKAGDVVKVKVLEVDVPRKRIALTMRLNDEAGAEKRGRQPENESSRNPRSPSNGNRGSLKNGKAQRERAPQNSAMADALAKLKR